MDMPEVQASSARATTIAATSGSACRRHATYTASARERNSSPDSQATPGSPNHSSTCAITTCGSHWVGTQSAVANVLTEPGWRSGHAPVRNSWPKRRWK
jgi:hypothetical protein